MHHNRLIAYYKRGHPRDDETRNDEEEPPLSSKRIYSENSNCNRWQKQNEQPDESDLFYF
jgi:hypothetical protein